MTRLGPFNLEFGEDGKLMGLSYDAQPETPAPEPAKAQMIDGLLMCGAVDTPSGLEGVTITKLGCELRPPYLTGYVVATRYDPYVLKVKQTGQVYLKPSQAPVLAQVVFGGLASLTVGVARIQRENIVMVGTCSWDVSASGTRLAFQFPSYPDADAESSWLRFNPSYPWNLMFGFTLTFGIMIP